MPAFHEIQFPGRISYGATGGPRRLTDIVTLKSGFEERNQAWQHSRRRYDAGMGLRNISDLQAVVEFWEARAGQLYGFRWKDWADYKTSRGRLAITALDATIAVGDGATVEYQLVKRYQDTQGEYTRPIRKPVAGSALIALDGVVSGSGWTIDYTTGLITFDVAPGNSVVITGGFEFDVPARFNADELDVSVDAFEAGSIPAIDVIEIRV